MKGGGGGGPVLSGLGSWLSEQTAKVEGACVQDSWRAFECLSSIVGPGYCVAVSTVLPWLLLRGAGEKGKMLKQRIKSQNVPN